MAVVYVTRSPAMLVSLADLKTHLRVDASFDDAYITGIEPVAVWDAENFCHRAVEPQTIQLLMDHFPGYPEHYQAFTDLGIMGDSALGLGVPPVGYTYRFQSEVYFRAGAIILPKPRLQSVDFIKYIDQDGQTQTLDPSRYVVDSASEPARVAPAPNCNWPLTMISVRAPVLNAVIVQYQAGYSPALTLPDGITPDEDNIRAAVPPSLLHALKLMVSQLYEVRSPVIAGPRVDAVEVPYTIERLLYPHKVIYQ